MWQNRSVYLSGVEGLSVPEMGGTFRGRFPGMCHSCGTGCEQLCVCVCVHQRNRAVSCVCVHVISDVQ